AAGIGAKAIGCGMTETYQACVADHQIQAHGQQPKDQSFGQERHGEDWQSERRRRQQDRREKEQPPAAHRQASRPSRPPGLITSTRSMSRYIAAIAKSGK